MLWSYLMPYSMKIKPIDFNEPPLPNIEPVVKPVVKSRLIKRLFERPFSSVLRAPTPHKPSFSDEFELSSVCLADMVQNFIEENNDKPQQQRCGTKRSNCFNGNCTDSSDEDNTESSNFSSTDAADVVKSLVLCCSVSERNLLADTSKIVERNKISKRRDGLCRKIVVDGLTALGYKASICKSKWDKSPSFPAGEYEYVDVVIEGERFVIDIDFRSEFEIARSTKAYKMVLQTLPSIFVGKADRLEKVIDIACEAANQSLKKKGMPVPPWRKAGYVKAKWLSHLTRTSPVCESQLKSANGNSCESGIENRKGGVCGDGLFVLSNSDSPCKDEGGVDPVVKKWELPEIRPKTAQKGVKIVTGLASIIEDKP